MQFLAIVVNYQQVFTSRSKVRFFHAIVTNQARNQIFTTGLFECLVDMNDDFNLMQSCNNSSPGMSIPGGVGNGMPHTN